MSDTVEFYHNGSQRPFLVVDSSFQPDDGDLINIKALTYKVMGRSFSVDYSDEPGKRIRCNVIVKKEPQ